MNIYISGAITGVKNFEKLFEACEKKILEKYPSARIINPCKIPMQFNPTYADYIKADIKELLRCDIIILLDNWRKSKGAKCEYRIACCCGLKIIHEKEL